LDGMVSNARWRLPLDVSQQIGLSPEPSHRSAQSHWETIRKGHEMDKLMERLRNQRCDREPFTPEHADCICRLTNEAADAIVRAARDERAVCQMIAASYGGNDAEEIAELIGSRNFAK